MVVRDLLIRGMIAGLIAGVLTLGWATAFGEPQIGQAIRFEASQEQTSGAAHEAPLVSRTLQETIGLGTAVVVVGLVFGGLFALGFAVVYGRFLRTQARVTALILAVAGFCTASLVPFLKYPANPPAVGQPETIGRRTTLYFAMILITLLTTVLSAALARRWHDRFGAWNATLLALAVYVAVIAIAYVVMPGVNEVPTTFPATVLWRFRLAALGGQAVLWATIGLAFGGLLQKSLLLRMPR